MRGEIPNQQTRQYDAQPIHVPQNVGAAAPKLFACVESPWYTAEQMGGGVGTDLGIYVAAVGLPIVDQGLKQKIDIPTIMLSDEVFAQCYVTDRDADNFPRRAMVSYDVGSRDAPVTKLYCGPTLAGRPFRSQIVCATPADGKWWLTGTINPSIVGEYVSASEVDIGLPASGAGSVDACMPPGDPEYSENRRMPASQFSFSADLGVAVGDIVVCSWIGNAYFMMPIQCSEIVA